MAFSATGGDKTTDGLYTVHTFTSSGSLVCTESMGPTDVEVLVVGGGGAGGSGVGGGGGAGGYLSGTETLTGTMTVTVGAGGAGQAENYSGHQGESSVFGTRTAYGGGGGASQNEQAVGTNVGSGGGGSGGTNPSHDHMDGTGGQGNAGGDGQDFAGGGGGGAGGVGQGASGGNVGGNGGSGTTFHGTTYAGGGGGGARTGDTAGTASGGGGAGSVGNTAPTAGTANRGGGGGGAGGTGPSAFNSYPGADGGSGIVIVRYLTPTPESVEMEASGTIALSGSADLTAEGFVTLEGGGTVALSGEAWLSAIAHGADSLHAEGDVALRGTARLSLATTSVIATSSVASPSVITTTAPHGLSGGTAYVTISGHSGSTPAIDGDWLATITGASTFTIPVEVSSGGTGGSVTVVASLPATDGDGWTTPDVTEPDIRGLSVVVSGIAVNRAQITDLVIELDTEGGPKSATLTLNCALDAHPRVGRDTLLVTYKSQTLFRGRLENMTTDLSSSTGYTLTYAGPLVTLRDHKAYRTVFVDSDLQSWNTDQGPRTSPDTFEVASRSSGNTV